MPKQNKFVRTSGSDSLANRVLDWKPEKLKDFEAESIERKIGGFDFIVRNMNIPKQL